MALWDGVNDFYGLGVQPGRITIYTHDTEKMTIKDNGNVGIGTENPGYKLHVNGSVVGVGAYNDVSDIRYKKNIETVSNALEKVLRIRGVAFDWNQDKYPDLDFDEGRQIGLSTNSSHNQRAGFWYQAADLVTCVEQIENDLLPKEFRLEQNYPNPFNPTTTIQFSVPKRSQVTLTLFDLLGREVATLVDEELQPGEFKVMFDASSLASGVYLYRLKTEEFVRTRKLTLLK